MIYRLNPTAAVKEWFALSVSSRVEDGGNHQVALITVTSLLLVKVIIVSP